MSSHQGGAEFLSNEAILGLRDESQDNNSKNPEALLPAKQRRQFHKLTEEFMLGPRGIPNLQKHLINFKFAKKAKHRTSYEKYKQGEYGSSHHFQNLTNLLHLYQKWGHDIYPKYKFADVIPVISRASSKSLVKQYKRKLHMDEIRQRFSTATTENTATASTIDTNPTTSVSIHQSTVIENSEKSQTNSLFVGDNDESEDDLYTPTNNTALNKPLQQQPAYEQNDLNKERTYINDDDEEDDEFLRGLDRDLAILDKAKELSNSTTLNSATIIPSNQANQVTASNDKGFAQDDDDDDDFMFSDDDQLLDEALKNANKSKSQSREDDDIPEDLMNQAAEEEEDPEFAIMREMGL